MKLKLLVILIFMLMGHVTASVPSWILPGVTATYDTYAASVDANGNYYDAVTSLTAMRVTSVENNMVSLDTMTDVALIPGSPDWMEQSTCVEGSPCEWKFWEDPTHLDGPVGTAIGNEKIAGKGPYTDSYGREWMATILNYQNPSTGYEKRLIYETETGLLLAYTEKYINEHIFLYLNSLDGA